MKTPLHIQHALCVCAEFCVKVAHLQDFDVIVIHEITSTVDDNLEAVLRE
jgi:hypothetical protein